MNIPWPKDNYQVRITEAKFGASKRTDNPMITLDCEVVSPEIATIDGKETTLAGTPLKHYLVTKVFDGSDIDNEKTKGCQDRLKEFFETLKLSVDELDWDNPDVSVLEGKTIWVILSAKAQEKRKDPTAEQRAAGQLGEVLVDPITGVKQVTYYPQIENVYGLVQ